MWGAGNDKAKHGQHSSKWIFVSLFLLARGARNFKVNIFAHGAHSSPHKRLLLLTGRLLFWLNVLLAWFPKDDSKLKHSIVRFILWCRGNVIQRMAPRSRQFEERNDPLLDLECVLRSEHRAGCGRNRLSSFHLFRVIPNGVSLYDALAITILFLFCLILHRLRIFQLAG